VTSTAELTATDLELLLAYPTGDDFECDGLGDDECTREAVARAVWDGECDHAGETLLCVEHRDQLAAEVESGRDIVCEECGEPVRLVAIEPLR